MKKEIKDRIDKLERRLSKLEQGEPECTCGSFFGEERSHPDPNCLAHPDKYKCKKCGRISKVIPLDQGCPFCVAPAPEPPLHVRVEIALGSIVKYWPKNRYAPAGWLRVKKGQEHFTFVLQAWEPIPDRTKSVKLAISALEEYLSRLPIVNINRQRSTWPPVVEIIYTYFDSGRIKISHHNRDDKYHEVVVYFGEYQHLVRPYPRPANWVESLPLAICEAIDKHHKAAK